MTNVSIELNQAKEWLSTSDLNTLCSIAALVADREMKISVDEVELSLSLIGSSTMRDLHLRYFDDPSDTDIITFPGDTPDNLGAYLGDLVICGEVAEAQSHEAQHSFLREVAFLLVHGLLHIAGWDDIDPDDRQSMLQRQDELITIYEAQSGVQL